jgi:uncharacterized Ntn-hydrolase superfamily protein
MQKSLFLPLIALLVTMGVVYGAVPATPSDVHLNTWTIVALDPATGDVGIAGASCVPVKIDAIAALVPGKGVATTQAAFNKINRDKVMLALNAGVTAQEVITAAFDLDDDLEDRQYGVVTLNDGVVHVAAYTGEDTQAWTGAITDTAWAVSVQGNLLVSEDVAQSAYSAFTDETIGDVHMADRLMRALEAGSAAGGDSRCNQQGVEQTAAATFIMVARNGEEAYSVPSFGLTAISDPDKPWLALSVNEPILGRNPIPELRTQYDTWRSENLPPCEECTLAPFAELPVGAEADRGRSATGIFSTLFDPVAVRFYGLVGVALFAIVLILIFRWRGKL